MPGAAVRWLHRLAALEASILSDRSLRLKQWLSWIALLALVTYYGAASEWLLSPNQLDYLQAPARFEGARFYVSFTPLTTWTEGPGYLFRTILGWAPIREPLQLIGGTGYQHSLYGIWHADGTITVVHDLPHPLRALKGEVSAAASVALVAALFYRYVLPRRR